MDRLTIDIETIPADWTDEQIDAAARAAVPGNYKKEDTIAAWIAENREKVWRDTALDPMQGRIVCVGWAIDDELPTSRVGVGDDVLRATFNDLLDDISGHRSRPVWIGHCIDIFDVRWLMYHALRLRHPIAGSVPFEKWSRLIVDTYALWAGPNPKGAPGKLDDIAKFLGLPGKPEGIDGSAVFDLWRAGRLDTIGAYCRCDVGIARDVWRILAGHFDRVGENTPDPNEFVVPLPVPATTDPYDDIPF